jgi:hypothetical protein
VPHEFVQHATLNSNTQAGRRSRGWDARMPAKGVIAPLLTDPIRSARTLRELLKKVEATGLHNAPREVLGEILSVALGLPKTPVMSSKADFRITSDTVTFCRGSEK